jgi:hypothetical protein
MPEPVQAQHSWRKVPITRSQMALARSGLLEDPGAVGSDTASKEAVKLVSRLTWCRDRG